MHAGFGLPEKERPNQCKKPEFDHREESKIRNVSHEMRSKIPNPEIHLIPNAAHEQSGNADEFRDERPDYRVHKRQGAPNGARTHSIDRFKFCCPHQRTHTHTKNGVQTLGVTAGPGVVSWVNTASAERKANLLALPKQVSTRTRLSQFRTLVQGRIPLTLRTDKTIKW